MSALSSILSFFSPRPQNFKSKTVTCLRRVSARATAGGPPPHFALHFLFAVRQIPRPLSDMLVVLSLGPFSGARSRARSSIRRRLFLWWLHGEVMRRLSRRIVGF
ncbi:hypothetical protein Bca4012_101242 [Brassica carinata]|uniref:Uncharacterized protein n=1 Tax=Brassica carinata TaxID=52824 RepID=A0A8X7PJI5_BRACI|nr:hypothetical protein Bca52824_083670 [Brassica carinata]